MGCHSGIGLESSILFASEGAHVVLADINLQGAQHTASHITKSYPNARTLVVKADVGKESEIKGLVDQTIKEFGRLDVMVRVPAPSTLRPGMRLLVTTVYRSSTMRVSSP